MFSQDRPVPIYISRALFRELLIVLITTVSFTAPLTTGNDSGQNLTNVLNETNIFVRSPPTKSLYSNNHLYHQPGHGLMKNLFPYPVRESYIAFEQARPLETSNSGQNFDEYFRPSKFPPAGFDSSEYYTRLQNNYPPGPPPQPSPYYPPNDKHPSSFYLPLPPPPPPPPFLRLVNIPGNLEITVTRGADGTKDLEILCEYPRYILIVQEIYWHFIPPPTSLLLPYGSFYDSRNGFEPRVTVTSRSKWKSVLRVRDYSQDDFGTYRCVSTAILPDEPAPKYSFPFTPTRPPPQPSMPPTSYLLHFPPEPTYSELRSSASTISSSQQPPTDEENVITLKRARRIKFGRNRREIGTFGVYAPFFKPHYGIYRIFKQVEFEDPFLGSGSNVVENAVNSPKEVERGGAAIGGNNGESDSSGEGSSKRTKNVGRKFDFAPKRKTKVLF